MFDKKFMSGGIFLYKDFIYEQAKNELNKFIELEVEFNLKYDKFFEPITNPKKLNEKKLELLACHLIDGYEENRIILTSVRSELTKRIESLSDRHKTSVYTFILKSKYIYKNSLAITAEKLNYSYRHINRLFVEAVQIYANKHNIPVDREGK
jgi:hypothetical protein